MKILPIMFFLASAAIFAQESYDFERSVESIRSDPYGTKSIPNYDSDIPDEVLKKFAAIEEKSGRPEEYYMLRKAYRAWMKNGTSFDEEYRIALKENLAQKEAFYQENKAKPSPQTSDTSTVIVSAVVTLGVIAGIILLIMAKPFVGSSHNKDA